MNENSQCNKKNDEAVNRTVAILELPSYDESLYELEKELEKNNCKWYDLYSLCYTDKISISRITPVCNNMLRNKIWKCYRQYLIPIFIIPFRKIKINDNKNQIKLKADYIRKRAYPFREITSWMWGMKDDELLYELSISLYYENYNINKNLVYSTIVIICLAEIANLLLMNDNQVINSLCRQNRNEFYT